MFLINASLRLPFQLRFLSFASSFSIELWLLRLRLPCTLRAAVDLGVGCSGCNFCFPRLPDRESTVAVHLNIDKGPLEDAGDWYVLLGNDPKNTLMATINHENGNQSCTISID